MNRLESLYRQPLSLLTDLYQLTMAYAYWRAPAATPEATFHLGFRENPFGGGYTIACGLGVVIDYVRSFHFTDEDLTYLSTLNGGDDTPLFEEAFLEYLRDMRFSCDIDAIPEGKVVFPNEPLLRISGPIDQCQILETPILNLINFQSLVATKAARIVQATRGEPVIEFGLRRAQGPDGAIAASRAAFVGGCTATSNLLAGKLFGIPVRGTHAHSWVMSFANESEAFSAYADALPNNCVFLVDTYDTIEGVRRAIEVGQRLRQEGQDLLGIRLDSGDLAYLSIEARRMLDEAGFHNTQIVASNDLDEHIVGSLKEQGAAISVWGIGTRLATGYDQPALGGVYKLTAVRPGPDAEWEPRIKLAEQQLKITTPGRLQVRRFEHDGELIADAVYDIGLGIDSPCTIVDPMDMTRRKQISDSTMGSDLLVPIFRAGECVYDTPDLETSQQLCAREITGLHSGVRRFVHPHEYPVGLETKLHELRTQLILEARKS